MLFLVVLVVDNPDDCGAVLEAWEKVGVSGVTILESTGLGRFKKKGLRDDIPLMPSLRDLLQPREERHRTLFSVVEGQAIVDLLIEKAQSVIGSLDQENSGFLFVVPVQQAIGLRGKRSAS